MIALPSTVSCPTQYILDGISPLQHICRGPWTILFHAEFEREFSELGEVVQDALLATLGYVGNLGPSAGRPTVDTLKGSRFANMKELRFRSRGSVWRFAFAFDPKRRAVVLCGGSKSGTSERRFYRVLIERADKRFASYLASLGNEDNA